MTGRPQPPRARSRPGTRTLPVPLPPDLIAELDQAAHERMVSRSILIEGLLRAALPLLVPVSDLVRTADGGS